MIDFGERLSTLRQTVGFSKSRLAYLVGQRPVNVYSWETGISRPNFNSLLKLSEVLNVTLDELMKGDKQ